MNELQVVVKQEVGKINWNFEELKTALATEMKKYTGIDEEDMDYSMGVMAAMLVQAANGNVNAATASEDESRKHPEESQDSRNEVCRTSAPAEGGQYCTNGNGIRLQQGS